MRCGVLLGGALAVIATGAASAAPPAADWPTLGRDPGGTRFSPLSQITAGNVNQLSVAWLYHMRKPEDGATTAGQPPRLAPSESVPLVVNGILYMGTPYGRVIALDVTTREELWAYTLPNKDQPAIRGVEYHAGSSGRPPSIVFGTRDGKLISINARTGKPTAKFGRDGVVDLKTPDIMAAGTDMNYGVGSPPLVYRDLVIVGSLPGESIGGGYGYVRAFNAYTGELAWTFHTIPRQGEFGFDTWANGSGRNRSGVNVWGLMTLDAERGIVYLPLGAPTNDRIGTDRAGDNLFSSSIVALNAKTGKRLWHFQLVRHDIWDYDTAAPPTLITVTRRGRSIPAVAMTTKNGLLFIANRVTGEPLYEVEDRPVPPSDVPGEVAAPTQPFPVTTEPLARQGITNADLAKVTPELEAFCRRLVEENNLLLGAPYQPIGFNRPTVSFPGISGGVSWAGGTFDPTAGYYVVNVLNFGQIQTIVRDDSPLGFANRGRPAGRFWNPETKQLCNEPPWGELVAVNVNTGLVAWRSRLGITENLPEGRQNTGRPSIGGPITTAGGLTFIAATDDSRIRAFETRSGREVWAAKLPGGGQTNPISFADRSGKQYVAITATGGAGYIGVPTTSDAVVFYSLP